MGLPTTSDGEDSVKDASVHRGRHTPRMPRIAAASIEENRDLRRSAILAAASQLARRDGLGKLTVGAVAKEAGLARSSVYDYFPSVTDIIAEVLVDELLEMCEQLAEGVAPARSDAEVVQLWIRTSLVMVADGRHKLLSAVAGIDFPATRRTQINSLHRRMAIPLVEALANHGVSNPRRLATQIASVVEAAVRLIEAGSDPDEEIAAAERFVIAGLRS